MIKENTLPRIMIVDDSSLIRSLLQALFVDEGYKVVGGFDSGKQLLANIARLTPNVICLDYNLPDENGIELLIKIHEAHPRIAVVMITGNESKALEKKAADAGASGFLRKPFTPQDIARELKRLASALKFLAPKKSNEPPLCPDSALARVVIADDSLTMRMMLSGILEEANFKVVAEACDGKQAVEQVLKHKPDFVCLDINMPVMSGLKALSQIRMKHPNIKALMITANADRSLVVQASAGGANGYIIKPYEAQTVIDVMTKLL